MHRTLLSLMAAFTLSATAPAAPLPEAAKADNALTFALLREVSQGTENVVFSPLSIWTALAMTSAGAEGETLKQMRAVLHLPEDDAAAHALAGGWAKDLKALAKIELNVANRLWGAQELPFHDEFLKLTAEHYQAGLETLDFKGDADKSRLRINDWIAKETKDRIKDLLQPGNVTAQTKLVLTNAVYFKGTWREQFKGEGTADRGFTLVSDEMIAAKAMSARFAVDYMENDRLQAVRLPYVGGQTSMIVVLPRKVDALKDAAFLDAGAFAAVQQALKAEPRVVVQMPRFETSARMGLADVLSRLGMGRAFTASAEFGRMCREPLMISDVIHKAWVKVAEEGTEAAAATAVTMMRTAAPRPEPPPRMFIADHPFLFFIVDDRNGGVLFAGRVMDPRK